MRDGYYIQGQGAVIFFDVTSRVTYKNVPNWHKDLVRVCGEIPMVLVGNKVDVKVNIFHYLWLIVLILNLLKDRKVLPKHITFHRKKNLQYYDLSAKSNYNIEKPFLYLTRRLLGDSEVHFVEQPAVAPPEIVLDPELVKKQEQAWAEAAATPLMDEEDNDL